ncbi:hypothetical protein Tco_0797916 [Tanacetum coccineum]
MCYSSHLDFFSIVDLYLYKLAITLIKELKIYSEVGTTSGIRADAEYRKLLAAQKNNMHVNNKSDMKYVKKLEGQVVAYQKQQLSYEEKLKLQANDLYDKKLQIEKYKKTAEKALKEKEELKTRLESFDTSSKSLNTMHNSQLIAKDKAGFGHDGVKRSKPINIVKPRKTMNDAMPTTYSYYKAYSSVKRPFNKKAINYNRYFNKIVNTVKGTRVSSARPKAEVNTVKASISWVWKPKHEELDHVSKSDSASKTLTRYDYVDTYGRFKSVLAWGLKKHNFHIPAAIQ